MEISRHSPIKLSNQSALAQVLAAVTPCLVTDAKVHRLPSWSKASASADEVLKTYEVKCPVDFSLWRERYPYGWLAGWYTFVTYARHDSRLRRAHAQTLRHQLAAPLTFVSLSLQKREEQRKKGALHHAGDFTCLRTIRSSTSCDAAPLYPEGTGFPLLRPRAALLIQGPEPEPKRNDDGNGGGGGVYLRPLKRPKKRLRRVSSGRFLRRSYGGPRALGDEVRSLRAR